jgi:hypothetical protein
VLDILAACPSTIARLVAPLPDPAPPLLYRIDLQRLGGQRNTPAGRQIGSQRQAHSVATCEGRRYVVAFLPAFGDTSRRAAP